jgi:hypothetical protein
MHSRATSARGSAQASRSPPFRAPPALDDFGLANRGTGALISAMTNSRKTHHLRKGEALSLCGAPAWLVAIVPAVVPPTCANCARIRAFQGRAAIRRGTANTNPKP